MVDYDHIYFSFVKGNLSPFYAEMFPGLLRFTASILGGELSYMSEDCLQDAIIAAYVRRKDFSGSDHWRSSLFKYIRNRAVEIQRKANSSRNYTEYLEILDSDSESIEADLIEQETMDAFFAAIRALPRRYREIVEFSFEQGLKNEEVGRILGITEVAVRKRKIRLIELLRTRLGGKLSSTDIIVLLMLASLSDSIDTGRPQTAARHEMPLEYIYHMQ